MPEVEGVVAAVVHIDEQVGIVVRRPEYVSGTDVVLDNDAVTIPWSRLVERPVLPIPELPLHHCQRRN